MGQNVSIASSQLCDHKSKLVIIIFCNDSYFVTIDVNIVGIFYNNITLICRDALLTICLFVSYYFHCLLQLLSSFYYHDMNLVKDSSF